MKLSFRNYPLFSPAVIFATAVMLLLLTAGKAAITFAADQPVRVETVWSHDRAQPGSDIVLAVIIDIAPGYHINPDAAQLVPETDFKPFPTRLSVLAATGGIVFDPPRFPEAQFVSVAYTSKPLTAFSGRVVIYLPARIDPHATTDQVSATLDIAYQACDDKVCYFPETRTLTTRLAMASREKAPVRTYPDIFDRFDRAEPPAFSDKVGFDLFGIRFRIDTASGIGLILLLITAALGGFLLNFTPCVLPLIPIKIISLSHAAINHRRCMTLGLSMFLGVTAFWLLLGVAIGTISGFTATNQLFQYPMFTITVGVIIAVMAFGMCGLFSIRLPNFIYAFNPKQDTLSGSFGLGVLAAILSTPCTAPFMGAAAAWAATQPPSTTLATFAAIGIGMALPYFVLSAFPSLVKRMPHSGPGSNLIKQVMGLFMLGAAAYFIGSGTSALMVTPPNPPGRWYWWLVMGFLGAAAVWMAVRSWQIAPNLKTRVIYAGLGTVLFIGSIMGGYHFTDRGPVAWIYYTPQQFQNALSKGKVVVMVFTAEWCLNCKALEQSVLNHRSVAAELNESDVAAIKVDITGRNPDGKARLQATGQLTIPLLVIYDGNGQEVFKSDFYTPDQIIEGLKEARSRS